MTKVFHARLHDKFIETKSNVKRKKHLRVNQGSIFLVSSFNNRHNVRALVQFRRVRQSQHFER